MTRKRWEELEKKYAPLGVTFDEKEFATVRCLKCSEVQVCGDSKFYCDPCLLNSDAEVLESVKIYKGLRLFDQMVSLEVMTKTEGKYLPNHEFGEYLKECMKRNYESTGIEKGIGFKNPDITNYIRFVVDG